MASSFHKLPQGILLSVFSQLHDDDYTSFISLRSACRRFRKLSEELTARDITLISWRDAEQALFERTLMPNETLGRTIHRVRLKPPASNVVAAERISQGLEECWGSLVNLEEIIWECSMHIPKSILSMLAFRPEIRLLYINNERGNCEMDKALLSSPNLYFLSYTVLANDLTHECLSKMNELKECFLCARGLKVLHLEVDRNNRVVSNNFTHGPLNIPFQHGDLFPALEELALDPHLQNYSPTKDHCDMWARCMDWSRLHKLDLNHGSPPHLLKALTGRIPQLKVFNFGFWERTQASSGLWNCDSDLSILTRFLSSIEALESVKMYSWDDEKMRLIRPALLASNGVSLRHLESSTIKRNSWGPEEFLVLRERAPGLQSLVAPIKLQPAAEGHGEGTIWPDVPQPPKLIASSAKSLAPNESGPVKRSRFGFARLRSLVSGSRVPPTNSPQPSLYLLSQTSSTSTSPETSVHTAITSFPNLTHLCLTIGLSSDSYQFTMDPRDPFRWGSSLLKKEAAGDLTLRLWHDLRKQSEIERLELLFLAPNGSNKKWRFSVQNKSECGQDGLWRSREVLGVEEEGFDLSQGTLGDIR